jgi:hypothetical protein
MLSIILFVYNALQDSYHNGIKIIKMEQNGAVFIFSLLEIYKLRLTFFQNARAAIISWAEKVTGSIAASRLPSSSARSSIITKCGANILGHAGLRFVRNLSRYRKK